MIITIEAVREYLNKANDILTNVVPGYKKQYISDITLVNKATEWATISKRGTSFSLKVSNIFNLIHDEDMFYNRLLSCMVHELIHTMPCCMNHGEAFKSAADKVNKKYNLGISRCNSCEDSGFSYEEAKLYCSANRCSKSNRRTKVKRVYVLTCIGCKGQFKYNSRTTVVKIAYSGKGTLRCPNCSGNLFSVSSKIK